MEDLGIDGKTVFKCILGFVGVDWIHLAQDRDHWQALMNMQINLWVAKGQGIS
jgi:PII-like signaling protein